MQAGELPAQPEVDIDSRPRATEKRDASNSMPLKTKGAPSKSKAAKGKTVTAQPSFQTAAEDEFFGNDSAGEDESDEEDEEEDEEALEDGRGDEGAENLCGRLACEVRGLRGNGGWVKRGRGEK